MKGRLRIAPPNDYMIQVMMLMLSLMVIRHLKSRRGKVLNVNSSLSYEYNPTFSHFNIGITENCVNIHIHFNIIMFST